MLNRIYSIFFMIFLLVGCSTANHKNETLIKPWSKELAKSQPLDPPFIATYISDDKVLVFVGVAHENRLESKSFETMRRVFKNMKFGIVIAEGFSYDQGVNHLGQKRRAMDDGKDGFFRGEESNYAIVLANKYNIPFVGGEPETVAVADSMKSFGYSREDYFYLEFLQMIAQWKRGGVLLAKELPECFGQFAAERSLNFGALKDVSFPKFIEWYQLNNRIAFEPATIDSNTAAPMADGDLKTQQISAVVGQVRDEKIFDVIKTSLSKYKKVVVVYGAGHWSKQRPALESIMGRPQLEKIVP